MPEFKRVLFTVLALLALLAVPAAALAGDELILATAEESDDMEEPAAPVNESGIEPAVEADPRGEEEAEQPWTARFLAPLVLTLGVVGLLTALVTYFVRIQGRYRVAE